MDRVEHVNGLLNKDQFEHQCSYSVLSCMLQMKSYALLFISEELREYFSKYGAIESINVKTDPTTGRSRGFAFLVFNSAETIDKVIR